MNQCTQGGLGLHHERSILTDASSIGGHGQGVRQPFGKGL